MDNVALFGGGFDPIGTHHVEMAEEVFRQTGMQTWMMPCWGHRFSKNDRLHPPHYRWAMVERAAADQGQGIIVPFDWEIKHKHTGSMYETMEKLKFRYPGVRFHIVIGMDNAEVIETKWDRGNLLIQENPFIVFNRPGPSTATWFNQEPHRLFEFEHSLSSTAIRDAIASGDYQFAKAHVTKSVWELIKEAFLYGYTGPDKD